MRLLALPAELYPHMEESVNIEFYVRGLFTASTGLPAELYPHRRNYSIRSFRKLQVFFSDF